MIQPVTFNIGSKFNLKKTKTMLSNLLDKIKTPLFFLVTIILAIFSLQITLNFFLEYSEFAFGFSWVIASIAFFVAYDKVVLRKVDTITEIKKGNIAYAIFLFAHALIIAACIFSA